MHIDPDIVMQIALAAAAVIALCAMQPRWDTGGGALMIFVLGIVGIPVWAPLLMLCCTIFLVGMLGVLGWYVIGFPLWVITRPLLRRFYYGFRHRKGEPVDIFWTRSYLAS